MPPGSFPILTLSLFLIPFGHGVTIAPDEQPQLRLAHGYKIFSVEFSPDGQHLAVTGESPKIRLWNLRTAKIERTLPRGKEGVDRYRFSTDSRFLAADDGLWDVRTGRLRRRIPTRSLRYKTTFYSCYSPDLKTLAAERGKYVDLLDVRTGAVRRTLIGHEAAVFAIAFSPDGRSLVSGGDDDSVRLWSLRNGKPRWIVRDFRRAYDFAFSSDGNRIACGHRSGVTFFDAHTGRILRRLSGITGSAKTVVFSPDGRLVAATDEDNGVFPPATLGVVRIWDTDTGKLRKMIVAHSAPPTKEPMQEVLDSAVNSIAFSPDGRTLATAGSDNYVKLWSMGYLNGRHSPGGLKSHRNKR